MSDISKSQNTALLYQLGTGNWKAVREAYLDLGLILDAAEEWKSLLTGVQKPWLCWSVNKDWCLLQQRLVSSVGWTPVVGVDPRAGAPKLISNAILIDFNRRFQFPTMWFHFPLEFVFVFSERLAFWHSDLLLKAEKLEHLSRVFSNLKDGEVAAVELNVGLRNRFRYFRHRFSELIGCTTSAASRDQFEKGCGWWVKFADHLNCPSKAEKRRRDRYYWESGVGIRYWSRRYGGKVITINESYVSEGHFTRINNPKYQKLSPDDYRRDLTLELPHNFPLLKAARKLGLESFLHAGV